MNLIDQYCTVVVGWWLFREGIGLIIAPVGKLAFPVMTRFEIAVTVDCPGIFQNPDLNDKFIVDCL